MTALPSWAVPGRKVVCVNVTALPGHIPLMDGLTLKQVYTIRDIISHSGTGETGIRLVEIKRELRGSDRWEQPFMLWRFRPLVTQEEDMLTFRSLLNTVPSNLTLETI